MEILVTALETGMSLPSPWLLDHASVLPAGRVLDLACGRGRHARWLARHGWQVLAVDRDAAVLQTLFGVTGLETRCCDLEGAEWPLSGERFDAVVVFNYLHRGRLAALPHLLRPGGVWLYETFMCGNERFGRPSCADFLLQPDELKHFALAAGMEVIAFEQGEVAVPRPACVQRLCARAR